MLVDIIRYCQIAPQSEPLSDPLYWRFSEVADSAERAFFPGASYFDILA
jgi:hypothetical protein